MVAPIIRCGTSGRPQRCKPELGMEVEMASPIHAMRLSVVVGALSAGLVSFAGPANAQEALSGKVASQQEGAMEGVLVSAKRAGSTMTVTVVSDAQGRYSFPRERLDP